MAKGRKFSTNRSERLLGTNYTQGSTVNHEVTDFREEDVWSMVEDRERDVNLSSGEWDSRAPSWRRNREQDHRNLGGLSLAFDNSTRIVHRASQRAEHNMATSAPVNVPDWSKILRVDSVGSLHDLDDGFDVNDSEMVPPHEYLARGRKMAANSVFEGVGRTLKGRDLRRVRDAVWNQTGFDG
ncbi:protein S40-5-like [Cicer arietinum]|uniref:Uncharacterized protein LOC101501221 n=1 Tax=Cicer arietinum TaxID=3827 RepID=A0A1S2YNY2_CICAR|nr:uncharacterized protein LOC101501221 [Cicer arietinum]